MKPEEFFEIEQLEQQRRHSGKSYREFLRVASMSAGVYALPAGGSDPQKPHQKMRCTTWFAGVRV